MSSLDELRDVIKENLERRGVLGSIQAQVRAEVFNALDDKATPKPKLSNENVLINELIREYLDYNRYKYTASTLQAETGQAELPLDRSFLCSELNIDCQGQAAELPLLYSLVQHFISSKKPR